MALSIAFEDAKANQIRREADRQGITGGVLTTRFFGSRDNPDLPFANLTQQDPGRVSRTHFHIADQFQVIVGGKGKLGRHELAPYCVHFSRAYTPYGPLVADASTGLRFFVMRVHPDPGSQALSEKRDQLKQVPDRQPWQITRPVTFSAFQSGTAVADMTMQAIPDIHDERGLAAYTLAIKPKSQVYAPDPSQGDGQYLVVVKGSLLFDDKEYKAPALVFVYPKEDPFHIHTGSEGMEALVLNFPRPQTRATGADTCVKTKTGFRIWKCTLCAFEYDEAAGMPEEGIALGTRWKDVPETWTCPDCMSSKSDFQMKEVT